MRKTILPVAGLLVLIIAALGLQMPVAWAKAGDAREFAATLSGRERTQFEEYYAAKVFFQADLDAYWDKVTSTRSKRRKRIRSGLPARQSDYVSTFPPEYKGPSLSKSLSAQWAKFQARDEPSRPAKPKTELPGLSDYLAASRKYYSFEPERIAEREFKRRYAREALRLGLSKEQVVRVYGLETGGNGTADMQAGIHPISKKGRPISSALGYAQLLAANSVNEVVKHGNEFIERLQKLARAPGIDDERRARLKTKIKALGAMTRNAKSIPNKWASHQRFAKTGKGMGIHAINLDGDIGPWIQVYKLKGIKLFAEKKGRSNLDSTELELMNLAGPGTGIEMMTSVGLGMPTVNFFSRRGYERNSVVRGRTSQGLLEALGDRMNVNVKNAGAKEFFEVFDELLADRSARR